MSQIKIKQIADGTDGELITWGADGKTAVVATGTANQVLTSNGTGAAPTFQAASGGAAPTELEVNQTTHGFAVGDVIKYIAGAYAKAQADSAANAEAIGIVTVVTDANNFTVTQVGYTTLLSGLTANTTYFLDPTTAGTLTATEPSTDGQISKPMLYATSTTAGWVYDYRGIAIASDSGVLTTKGDVLSHNTTTETRIPVGTNDQVLTADSAEASGVKWATPSSGGASSIVRAYRSSNQIISTSVDTKIQFDNEEFDTGGDFDSTTNYRFTAPSAGKYVISFNLNLTSYTGNECYARIYKNGTLAGEYLPTEDETDSRIINVTDIYDLASSDYIELFTGGNDSSYVVSASTGALTHYSQITFYKLA